MTRFFPEPVRNLARVFTDPLFPLYSASGPRHLFGLPFRVDERGTPSKLSVLQVTTSALSSRG